MISVNWIIVFVSPSVEYWKLALYRARIKQGYDAHA